jgi:hypothetical protein
MLPGLPRRRTTGSIRALLAVATLSGLFTASLHGANPPASKPVGNAWTDPANPVVKRFKGERLELWSLRKPVRPPVPSVPPSAGCRNPIDHFILARQKAVWGTPNPEADRCTLIRRLSFDLLGLPPTPEDVQQFVADSRQDAYGRLVNRLLASRHYGERWGRHWLDVVRYADTNGYERDEFRPSTWRYRDYVIQAFNADKPFDQFIREQLAGDELVHQPLDEDGIEKLVATGYLRLGPYDSTASLFVEDSKGRDALMTDLVTTTGSAFLGLTLACCQCHDHKYDPLLQADHFRMRAFFAGVKFSDDLVVDPPRVRDEVARHNAAIDWQAAVLEKQDAALVQSATERILARRRVVLVGLMPALVAGRQGPLLVGSSLALELCLDKPAVKPAEAHKVFTAAEKTRHEELDRQIEQLKAKKRPLNTALAMVDNGHNAPPTHIFAGGDITRPLGEVPPGFLSVLDPNPASIPSVAVPNSTGRRTALANWIASRDNPLTARVLVNRLWQQHFGRGLVATPNDFGFSGTPPTHPELLDWLAVEFMESGWSVKHVQRLILQSATYRQSSTVDSAKQILDPENRTWWRQNIGRLDAETLRDAQLAVAGKLLPRASGSPLWPELPIEVLLANPVILEPIKEMEGRLEGYYTDALPQTDVRTVFTIQKRSTPMPMLQVFDQPDSTISCGRRTQSTVAPQALQLLNGPFAVRMARAFAARVTKEAGSDPGKQVDRAVWLALSRAPAADEQKVLVGMLARHRELHRNAREKKPEAGVDTSEQAALVDLCRVLLNLNEFLYVD